MEVVFAPRPVSCIALHAATRRITITLDEASVPDEALQGGRPARAQLLARTYRLTAVLFSQV